MIFLFDSLSIIKSALRFYKTTFRFYKSEPGSYKTKLQIWKLVSFFLSLRIEELSFYLTQLTKYMAKYIKQEMSDLNGKGEEKVYYRMKIQRNIDTKEFAAEVNRYNTLINKALIENVMANSMEVLARLLGEGYSVSLDGLGTFKAALGLKEEKEMDSFEDNEPKRNARSLQLTDVKFKADKALICEANKHCKLQREGESRLRHSPYTKEERLKLALNYLDKYGAMKVANYMEMTGLSHTKATLELQEFRRDVTSGITTIGKRSTLVYVKCTVE